MDEVKNLQHATDPAEREALLAERISLLERRREETERAQAALAQRAAHMEQRLHDVSASFAAKTLALRQPVNNLLALAKMLADNEDGNLSAYQIDYAQTIYSAGTDLLSAIDEMLAEAKRAAAGPGPVIGEPAVRTPVAWHMGALWRRDAAVRQPYRGRRSRRPDDGCVLIAEKDAAVAAALLARVRACGYEGQVATDAATLRTVLREHRPDAVVVGSALADADAWGAIRLLAAEAESRRLPVSMVAMRGDTHNCLEIAGGVQALDELSSDAVDGIRAALAARTPAPASQLVDRDGLLPPQREADAAGIAMLRHGGGLEEALDDLTRFLYGTVGMALPTRRRLPSRRRRRPLDLVGKKVLVVDGDIRAIYALTGTLEQQGMLVLHAENEAQCMAMLEKNPDIDAVLMDTTQPALRGFDAIRRIRGRAGFASLPILALATRGASEDRERCVAAGASDFLSKPVNDEQLVALLRAWLLTPR